MSIHDSLEVYDSLEVADTGVSAPVVLSAQTSSIVFPNQVKPLIDWSNPDTANLTSCTFDAGTAIYDCISGVEIDTFDSANELGTNTGISATWSAEKPSGIDDNPFALLIPITDTSTRYKIVRSNVNYTHTLDLVDTANLSKDFEIEFDLLVTTEAGYGQAITVIGNSNSAQNHIYLNGTTLRFGYQWHVRTFTLATPLSASSPKSHCYKIKMQNGNLQAWQDDVEIFVSSGDVTGITRGFRLYDGNLYTTNSRNGFESTYFKYVSNDFPDESRFWVFNQDTGTTVNDLINNEPLTLTGFDGTQWQEQFETRQFNIGSGLDYDDLTQHVSAQASVSKILHELTLTQNHVLNNAINYPSDDFYRVILKGNTPFNGILGASSNRSIKSDGIMTEALLKAGNTLEVHDLDIESSPSFRAFDMDAGSTLVVSSSGVKSSSQGLYANDNTIHALKSKIYSTGDNAVINASSNAIVHIADCDIRGNSATGAVRNQDGYMTMYNNVVRNDNGTDAITTVANNLIGSYNVTEDATHSVSALTNGINATLARDSDDLIESASQATLSGAGLNGSDIVSWAFAPIDTGMSFTAIATTSTLDTADLSTTVQADFALLSTSGQLAQFGLTTSTTIGIEALNTSSYLRTFAIDSGSVETIYIDSIRTASNVQSAPIDTTAQLAFERLLSGSMLDGIQIQTSTTLGYTSINTTSLVDSLDIDTQVSLEFLSTFTESVIDLFDHNLLSGLTFDVLSTPSAIDSFETTTSTVVELTKISTSSEIGQVSLYESIGYFSLNDLAFTVYPKDSYKITNNTDSYRIDL